MADKKTENDLEEYVRKIVSAEKSFDVNSFRYSGFRIWPLLRAQTINMFRNPEAYFAPRDEPSALTAGFVQKIRSQIQYRKLSRRFNAHLDQVLKGKKPSVLFYAKLSNHSDEVNGKSYDRFTDPFFDWLGESRDVLKITLLKTKPKKRLHYAHPPVEILHDSFASAFYHRQLLGQNPDLPDAEFIRRIADEAEIPFVARHIRSVTREVIYYREIFRQVFKCIRPQFVFMKCYYETDSAGLVLAAREAGIRTVDIQHGKQGIFHPMYSHWTAIPEKGYEILPDYFWNWGEESKENILQWMNRKSEHVPVVGGNLWMAKWKNEDFYRPTVEGKAFAEELKKSQKVILLTMQPLDAQEIIPAYLAEAIRKSPAGWTWLLRRHPFQKITREELMQAIGETAARVETDMASMLPLYFLLKKVNHHVTLWSSTCFEANDFDIPTVIAHDFGKKLYEKQIAAGIFSFAADAEGILRLIADGTRNTRTHYIETDPAVARDAFQQIGLSI